MDKKQKLILDIQSAIEVLQNCGKKYVIWKRHYSQSSVTTALYDDCKELLDDDFDFKLFETEEKYIEYYLDVEGVDKGDDDYERVVCEAKESEEIANKSFPLYRLYYLCDDHFVEEKDLDNEIMEYYLRETLHYYNSYGSSVQDAIGELNDKLRDINHRNDLELSREICCILDIARD